MQVFFLSIFILLLLYTVLLVYYRRAWQAIPPVTSAEPVTSITIIVPARNEAANITNCLNAIFAQQYPLRLIQVIVADDFSTDETATIVEGMARPGLQLLSLSRYVDSPLNSYKKKAIELAVAAATGQLIVTTDADCTMGPNWLATLAALYQQQQPAFIAAPVAIDCSNRPIEIFQALDFMVLQGITGGAVHKKIHSMCNGANLAYERTAFAEVGGFKGIDDIASGDDMLLMHKIYQRWPQRIAFAKSKTAIVQTAAMPTLTSFINQRIRWASKADKYDDKRIFAVLLLVYFLNVCLLLWPLMAIVWPGCFAVPFTSLTFCSWPAWGVLLALKTIAELYFLYPVAVFFNKANLLWWFPLAQPFHIVYTVAAGWLGKFGSYQWKERKVK